MLKGHCFPKAIISPFVYFKLRFSLSFRDVEELLSIRGVDKEGNTVDFLLTKRKQRISKQKFLIKAIENNVNP